MRRQKCRKAGGHWWANQYDFLSPFQECSRCGALAWRYHEGAEMPTFHADEIERLRSRITVLKAALTQISTLIDSPTSSQRMDWYGASWNIAIRALEADDEL